jgi:hypothetical protein
VADARVTEGDRGRSALVFPVTLTRPLGKALTVCAAAVPGTAHLLSDFDPYLGCERIAAGATSTSFTVQVRGDRAPEKDERLTLVVAGLDPGVRDLDLTATGTIVNDD